MFVPIREEDIAKFTMCIVMMQECNSAENYDNKAIQLIEMSTAVATDDEYMKRAFQTKDLSELYSNHRRPDLALMMLGDANASNRRMTKGKVPSEGMESPVDWDFVNMFPPAAANHEWQWYPVMAIDLNENCRMNVRYKGKRLLVCNRQMEEVGGEPSHQRWNARCFEVWPITIQVQEPWREHMQFLKAETTDLAKIHQERTFTRKRVVLQRNKLTWLYSGSRGSRTRRTASAAAVRSRKRRGMSESMYRGEAL